MAAPALEARNPLLAVTAPGRGGKTAPEQAGIAISRRGVIVTAFRQNPDGEGTLLRGWEQAGQTGEVSLTLPAGAIFKFATPVSLRGEVVGDPLTIRSGKLAFGLHAYGPASYLLK
jgi:hypothetical protein